MELPRYDTQYLDSSIKNKIIIDFLKQLYVFSVCIAKNSYNGDCNYGT